MAPSTSQLNSKRAASESNSEDESEEEDLGFGDSDYFHDNKYGEMKEYLRSIQTSHFIAMRSDPSLEVSTWIYLQTLLVHWGHESSLGVENLSVIHCVLFSCSLSTTGRDDGRGQSQFLEAWSEKEKKRKSWFNMESEK